MKIWPTYQKLRSLHSSLWFDCKRMTLFAFVGKSKISCDFSWNWAESVMNTPNLITLDLIKCDVYIFNNFFKKVHYLYCLIAQDHYHCICGLKPMEQMNCLALIKLHIRCASIAPSQHIFIFKEVFKFLIQFNLIKFFANWWEIAVAIVECKKPIKIYIVMI